jgi:hypothetical protein
MMYICKLILQNHDAFFQVIEVAGYRVGEINRYAKACN